MPPSAGRAAGQRVALAARRRLRVAEWECRVREEGMVGRAECNGKTVVAGEGVQPRVAVLQLLP